MKISRKSWHYRLAKLFDSTIEYQSKSDCQYIGHVIMSIFLMATFTMAAAFVLFLVFLAYIAVPVYLIFDFQPFNPFVDDGYFGKYFGLALLVYLITAWGLLCVAIKYGTDYYKNKKRKQEQRPDGLIKSYIKTKKEKVCTKVEFI